ncbi:MAG: sulfotransferase [Proteobacteria bacterium]|nr:sulfotransferase [Pseudomonadota bacterium]
MSASTTAQDDRGLFFLVGTGRCGTTLLQAMLSCHSRLCVPPETHFFASFDPAIDFADPLAAGDDAAYVERCRAVPHWQSLPLQPDELLEVLRGGTRSARALFLWWLRRLAGDGAPRGPRLGEKTPRHEQCVPRIAALFPEARFLHVVRDPRDVVASLREMPWASSPSVEKLAGECLRTYDRQERFAAQLGPKRYTTCRYEALVADPESELRRVCAFLGEAYEPGMLAYAEREAPGFFESERPWKADTLAPLDDSRIGRHRAALAPGELRTVERVLGEQLERLGYRPDDRPSDP